MSSTPSAKRAALNSGRGSRPGFSSSLRMSRTVGTPKVASRLDRPRGAGHDALHYRVGFRVHRRGIQRLVAIGDAQEAGALLEGLFAQARDLQQVLAALERAVVVPMADDVLGHRGRQAGHA
ncbi:hypothetical protein G6F24_018254 [Rhizopus arrhizus]|nr:hypothetical protein G6F24_018254 [Rhizopus arrhizus]